MCYCQALFRFPRKRLACLRSRTVLAVRRPSRTDSSWRLWSSTGTRTASSVPAVTVASVRWGPLSSLRPTFSSVGGTISGKLIIIEVGRQGELAVYLSQVRWLEMRNWGWGGGGGVSNLLLGQNWGGREGGKQFISDSVNQNWDVCV